MSRVMRISAVILASGMSKRMGTLKQLLPYADTTLLETCIRNVLTCPFHEVITIVGYKHESIQANITIDDERFKWQYNDHYTEGQSSALKIAASKLSKQDGMIVFLADQPLITKETIRSVFDHAVRLLPEMNGGLVVQPSYFGKSGHPVFFSHHLFSEFHHLKGDEGGKKVIKKAIHHEKIDVLNEGIVLDVDTKEDYERLLRGSLSASLNGREGVEQVEMNE